MEHFKIYLDENRLFYSLAAALLLVNLIFFLALLKPQSDKVEGLKKEYFSLRKERTRVREELKGRLAYSKKIEDLEKDVDAFIRKLPSEGGMTEIIKKLHVLARKAGLSIRSAKYSPSREKEKELRRLTISLPLVGSYKSIRKFIYYLEEMPYLMSIDDLSLSSNERETVSLSLNVSIYFRAGR